MVGKWLQKGNVLLFFVLCTSCYKGHLYVQQENIDKKYLASFYVDTPDPKKTDSFKEQNIYVSWDFPSSLFEKKLFITLVVRLRNDEEKVFGWNIDQKRGIQTFRFPLENDPKRKILTYRVEVKTEKGEIVEEWKHHFWTKLVDIDRPQTSLEESNF
ncbi:MAG: hypothetical protein WCP39_03165 [Chlamydiota bacterium]